MKSGFLIKLSKIPPLKIFTNPVKYSQTNRNQRFISSNIYSISLHSFANKKKGIRQQKEEKLESEKKKIRQQFQSVQSTKELLQSLKDCVSIHISQFQNELKQVRSGRANPKMFDNLQVNAYNEKYPFNDLCQTMVRGNNTILINVYDENVKQNVMKAIQTSDMDLSCSLEAKNIVVKILNTQSQSKQIYLQKAKKIEAKYKQKIKSDRTNILQKIKKLQKLIGTDEARHFEKDCEDQLKSSYKMIETVLKKKEREVMAA